LIVAKVEDENPNLDHPNLPGELSTPAEAAGPTPETEATPIDREAAPLEDQAEEPGRSSEQSKEASEEEESKEEKEEEKRRDSEKAAFYAVVAAAIGLPVICLALAVLQIMLFSTAFYLIGLGYIPMVLWLGRKTSTLYTVFLGCILAALMTAVYFFWIELGRYGFDSKAREAKQRRVSMTLPIDRDFAKARLHA
jgi:hypothetical protein